ncbi:hypothetical protein ACGFOU_32170 [Streptomyces sp. NPDC048595]|uniref:hypothetical protein n=1 Tax=Streptomyces sp. NPDC048595 TaxID=3365576 RepID=UPI00371814ED
MHTGGGFLAKTVVNDWDDDDHGRGGRDHGRDGGRDGGGYGRDHDRGGYGDHGRGGYGRDHDRGGYGDHGRGGYGDHRKPRGGIHTGGGGMATNSGLAAGSVLMLGGLGAGAYMLRRRNASGSAAA